MTIVADSGSTKTTWAVPGTRSMVVTEGLNPHFSTDGQVLAACATVRERLQTGRREVELHFYGAGCGDERQRERMRGLLCEGLGASHVEVETDMLGACRAVRGDEAGLVGILGTGSNACHYDGSRIVHSAVSTGYILGDHGSANHVGRQLLNSYLSGRMPEPLCSKFHEAYPLTREEFMDAVYHRPNANRFLASLAPFAVANVRNSYCLGNIVDSLNDWYWYQLSGLIDKSGCRRLSLVGGFAASLKSPLQLFAGEHGLVIERVVADPIKGLCQYHRVKKF